MATLDIVIISSGAHAIYNIRADCFDGGEAACSRESHGVAEKDRFGSTDSSAISKIELLMGFE